MCVPTHALLSALLLRVRAGYLVTLRDIDALLACGISRAELAAAFDEPGEAFVHARRTLEARAAG